MALHRKHLLDPALRVTGDHPVTGRAGVMLWKFAAARNRRLGSGFFNHSLFVVVEVSGPSRDLQTFVAALNYPEPTLVF